MINSTASVTSESTVNSSTRISIPPAATASNVIVPMFGIPSTDVKPSGIIRVTSISSALTVPWLNTDTLNSTVSPGYTLSSSPAFNVILEARSNISKSSSSKSASSSSPFSFRIESLSSAPSLPSLSSATLSISSGIPPRSSA